MTDATWRAQPVIFEQAAFAVLRCPVPVIAAVEGFALAAAPSWRCSSTSSWRGKPPSSGCPRRRSASSRA